ncbi:hypothetical protein IWQ60_011329, partial [Tieghemiomyces parasiticus]
CDGRGLAFGRFYNQRGVLVASVAQEGLILDHKTPESIGRELSIRTTDAKAIADESEKESQSKKRAIQIERPRPKL